MFGGGRRQTHETGTMSGDIGDTGDWSPGGIIMLQLCRVIITRRVCLLVSCPRHHATCRLQTHCRPADLVFVLEENKGKSFSMIYRELHISSCDHFFITWLVTWGHVSRVSWQRVTCHELSGGWTLVCICPLSSLHIIIICQKYWTQPTRNIK